MVIAKTGAEAEAVGLAPQRVIGRDAGPVARVFRVVAGATGVIPVIVGLVNGSMGNVFAGLAWLLVVCAIFTGFLALLRPWLRRNPGGISAWTGSALIMLPLMAYPFGLIPEGGPAVGVRLYTDGSVLLSGLIGYGGLEMAALPALVLGFRPVLYSQYNVVDLVERAMFQGRIRQLAALAGAVAMIGFTWFWIVPNIVVKGGPFEAAKATVNDLNEFFGVAIIATGLLLLVAGAAAIGRFTWALAALLAVFGFGAIFGAMPDALYAAIIVIGLASAVRLIRGNSRVPAPATP